MLWEQYVDSRSFLQHSLLLTEAVHNSQTSAASTLTYLDNAYLFVGSICGDSQILQIRPQSVAPISSPTLLLSPDRFKGKDLDRMQIDESESERSQGFIALDSWTNIAPVRDLCVVKQEGSDDSLIVTASGMASSGSLRIVKSGVGMEELAFVEGVTGVTALFPIGLGLNM